MWSAEMHGAGMIFKVSKPAQPVGLSRLRARLSRVSWAEPNLRGKNLRALDDRTSERCMASYLRKLLASKLDRRHCEAML